MPPPTIKKSVSRNVISYPSTHTRMDPVRIAVTTPSRAYTVAIENNAIDHLGPILDEVRAPERRFIVSSPPVWRLHGARVTRALEGAEPILVVLVVQSTIRSGPTGALPVPRRQIGFFAFGPK